MTTQSASSSGAPSPAVSAMRTTRRDVSAASRPDSRTSVPEISTARGPDSRTTPIAASPGAVASATIVLLNSGVAGVLQLTRRRGFGGRTIHVHLLHDLQHVR